MIRRASWFGSGSKHARLQADRIYEDSRKRGRFTCNTCDFCHRLVVARVHFQRSFAPRHKLDLFCYRVTGCQITCTLCNTAEVLGPGDPIPPTIKGEFPTLNEVIARTWPKVRTDEADWLNLHERIYNNQPITAEERTQVINSVMRRATQMVRNPNLGFAPGIGNDPVVILLIILTPMINQLYLEDFIRDIQTNHGGTGEANLLTIIIKFTIIVISCFAMHWRVNHLWNRMILYPGLVRGLAKMVPTLQELKAARDTAQEQLRQSNISIHPESTAKPKKPYISDEILDLVMRSVGGNHAQNTSQ